MATTEIKGKIDLEIKITLELSIGEAQALNEMVKYGSKPFLEGYYKHLGKSYLAPHERGVHSLFETVKESLPYKLNEVEKIFDAVKDLKAKVK